MNLCISYLNLSFVVGIYWVVELTKSYLNAILDANSLIKDTPLNLGWTVNELVSLG